MASGTWHLAWRRPAAIGCGRQLLVAAVTCLLITVPLCIAEQAPIPAGEITSLEAELAQGMRGRSVVDIRRACKSVARKAAAMIEASPEAPNRYAALGVLFKGQKRLLALGNREENRAAIFKTCRKLIDAPDEYAEIRFEAEMLLSERDLAEKNAKVAERVAVLEKLLARYRGTPAEARSLMIASLIATKLQAFDLEKTLSETMRDRLAGHHDVIQWRRKHSGLGKLEVMFAGTYTRTDGVPLHFPLDRMGRLSIMVFWSRETPGFELYLKQIQELQVQYPDRFDVFSFNLDELPDGGMAALRKLGLNWTVMRLPGGRKSEAFRTYAQKDPVAIFVNAYGRALLAPTVEKKGTFSILKERISDERYLEQLQSLFIGDFLVTAGPDERRIPKLAAIQKCFITAPFRYRLKPEQALANYTKAAKLCADAIKAAPKADISAFRNRRIIALMGMWNLACEPKYLAQAVKEANASLATVLPRGADVVPRFCLAKAALRRGDTGESALSAFVETTGGTRAPASAIAAASILALDANARDLYDCYRAELLASPDVKNPMLWPVIAFLRDRVHIYDLLRANYIWRGSAREREPTIRGHIINLGGTPTTDRLPAITLKTLNGGTLSLPQDTNGKLTLLVFVEPSAEPNAEFPTDADGEGKNKKGPRQSVLGDACNLADRHVNKDVVTIAAFLSEDSDRIEALMKTRELTCQAAMAPGGLANPMVRRLGILSADRIPNIFLLRRDGTIAWRASGNPYADGEQWVNLMAMKVQIEVCEVEHAYKTLEKGDFKEAARIFDGPYLPWNPDRFGWRSPRYHGQALAYMGLKDWDAALESIDKAIDAQKLRYFPGRRDKNPAYWRKEAATVTVKQPDDVLTELWATKTVILDKLGRKEDAATMSRRSKEAASIEPSSVYKLFHERLKNWRMNNKKEIR